MTRCLWATLWVCMLFLSISVSVFDAITKTGDGIGRMLLLTWLVQGDLWAGLTTSVLGDVWTVLVSLWPLAPSGKFPGHSSPGEGWDGSGGALGQQRAARAPQTVPEVLLPARSPRGSLSCVPCPALPVLSCLCLEIHAILECLGHSKIPKLQPNSQQYCSWWAELGPINRLLTWSCGRGCQTH